MARKASVGIQQLIDRTGPGSKVQATVVVDQIYAQDQHESLHYIHSSGGGAKYLERPLFEGSNDGIADFASRFLNARRGTARLWGDTVGKPLVRAVAVHAPVTNYDLRNSASLTVKEGGSIVMDIPAKVPRLSRAELTALDQLRTAAQHKRGAS